MILIDSPEIKNKNVVRDRIKIKIYNEKDLYDLLNKKDKEQMEIYNITTYSVYQEQCKILIFVVIRIKKYKTMDFTWIFYS